MIVVFPDHTNLLFLMVLRDGAELLKLPITWIINLSISDNKAPNEMKHARVNPFIPKIVIK